MASRTQSLTSVTTWSLRLRPVCSLRPTSPSSLDQGLLDVRVDVFELDGELELAALDLGADVIEGGGDLLGLVGGQAGRLRRACGRGPGWRVMSWRYSRRSKLIDSVNASTRFGVAGESAAPGFLAHSCSKTVAADVQIVQQQPLRRFG